MVSFACSRSCGQAVLFAFRRRETVLTVRFVREMHPTSTVFYGRDLWSRPLTLGETERRTADPSASLGMTKETLNENSKRLE